MNVPAAKHELFYYDTVAPDCSTGNSCSQLRIVAAHIVLPLFEIDLQSVVWMKMDIARICRWGLEPDRNDFILQDKVLAARNISSIKNSLLHEEVYFSVPDVRCNCQRDGRFDSRNYHEVCARIPTREKEANEQNSGTAYPNNEILGIGIDDVYQRHFRA